MVWQEKGKCSTCWNLLQHLQLPGNNLHHPPTTITNPNHQVPPSAGRLSKRLYKNVEYFQSNYVMVFLVLVLYCLISSPLLLIVMAATGGAGYIAGLKNAERKLSIAGS